MGGDHLNRYPRPRVGRFGAIFRGYTHTTLEILWDEKFDTSVRSLGGYVMGLIIIIHHLIH